LNFFSLRILNYFIRKVHVKAGNNKASVAFLNEKMSYFIFDVFEAELDLQF
jgi:hypothetical protein